MNRIKSYALNRLKEASTWKALAGFVATMIGYKMTGGQLEAAGTAGAAVYAFLSAILPNTFGGAPVPTAPVNVPVKGMLPEEEENKYRIPGQFP